MKTFNFKKVTGFALVATLILASCTKNDDAVLENETLSESEITQQVVSEEISSEVSNIVDTDELDFNDNYGAKSTSAKSGTRKSSVASCANRSVEDTADGKKVTIDFGDGCKGKRDKVFKGKIVITYVKNDAGFSKSVSFDGFSVDDNTVEGSKLIEKVKENANGNPQSTKTTNITITLTTGEVVTRKGTRVREKIEGSDTRNRGDDVVVITGNWETVNKEGETKKVTITTPLRREFACKYVVSGVVEIVKSGETFTLNYGDGSCDDSATLTNPDGTTEEITLKRKRRNKK